MGDSRATVGMLLRMLERRLRFVGRIIIGFLGAAWTLASFFVVPLLAAEDMGPGEALARSVEIFRETWGEELVGGFSFGVIFSLLALPGLLFPLIGAQSGKGGLFVGLALAVIYWLLLALINSAAQEIFVAALYRYATTGEVPAGFDRSDLSGAWQPKQ